MRADRLVSILLTLQSRGRATAGELASELEVSERTIRRDLDALLAAGVPLYSQRGRGGGWALLGGHRLDLSGLTNEEAEALVLAAGPGALGGLGDLGLEAGATSALRKLVAALPEPVRHRALSASAAVHRDPSGWGGRAVGGETHGAHLPELRRAVLAGVQVDLEYARPGGTPTLRRVHPLGLVLKRDVWYLLATTDKGNRTYRVSRVTNAVLTEEPVTRPEDFDLATAWGEMAKSYTSRVGTVAVRLRVETGEEEHVALMLGSWIPLTPAGADEFDAHFPNETVAVAELIRLGRRVEVIGPASVRSRLADAGRELINRYEEP